MLSEIASLVRLTDRLKVVKPQKKVFYFYSTNFSGDVTYCPNALLASRLYSVKIRINGFGHILNTMVTCASGRNPEEAFAEAHKELERLIKDRGGDFQLREHIDSRVTTSVI